MRISKVRIWNYRSIKCCEETRLDRHVTVLIGMNESGKTNFLKALQSFSRDYTYVEDDICDYCEAKGKLEAGESTNADIAMITMCFGVDKEDKPKLKDIHERLAQAPEIALTKFYDGRYVVEVDGVDISELESEVNDCIEDLRDWPKIRALLEQFLGQLDSHAQRLPEFASSKLKGEELAANFLKSAAGSRIEDVENAADVLVQAMQSLPDKDAEIEGSIKSNLAQLTHLLGHLQGDVLKNRQIRKRIADQLLEMVPSFIYFTDVDLLEDKVPLSELKSDGEKHRTILNLLSLAELDVSRIAAGSAHARRSRTELGSTKITGFVNEAWKQANVEVSIGLDGEELIIIVKDDVGVLDPPSRRSKGFQWFLAFYVNFMAGSRRELRNAVLLLDDPGVYLHPLGLDDLRRTMDELSVGNQVIIATHSPFLIWRDQLERIRIVEKQSDKRGTNIIEKYWASDLDAIAPLRAALGIKLGEMPLSAKRYLLVEGYQDLVYLEAVALYFRRTKRELNIDLSDLLILPINGANRAPFYTTVLLKDGFRLLVVLDYDVKGRAVKKELVEKHFVSPLAVVTLEQAIASATEERDYEIEDLFDGDLYKAAVAQAFEIETANGLISLDALDPSPKKLTKRYGQLFKKSKVQFDELAVARQVRSIIDSPSCDDQLLGETTLSNFGKLFELINGALYD